MNVKLFGEAGVTLFMCHTRTSPQTESRANFFIYFSKRENDTRTGTLQVQRLYSNTCAYDNILIYIIS